MLADGRKVTAELVRSLFQKQLETLRKTVGEERFSQGNYRQAAEVIEDIVRRHTFTEFMTLAGYEHLE